VNERTGAMQQCRFFSYTHSYILSDIIGRIFDGRERILFPEHPARSAVFAASRSSQDCASYSEYIT
jgi:hypothetical protein